MGKGQSTFKIVCTQEFKKKKWLSEHPATTTRKKATERLTTYHRVIRQTHEFISRVIRKVFTMIRSLLVIHLIPGAKAVLTQVAKNLVLKTCKIAKIWVPTHCLQKVNIRNLAN